MRLIPKRRPALPVAVVAPPSDIQCPAPTKSGKPCPFPPIDGPYCRVHRGKHQPPGPLAAGTRGTAA
jgi:hypothetical protein